jgi:GPH family glycoside/pentoside/hexuronide:cation symporter
MINVPYTALTPELTRDYDERTSLNSFRFAFSVGGTLVSAVAHPLIVGAFDNPVTGYMVSGMVWGLVCTIPCLVCFAYTRERPDSIVQSNESSTIPFHQQIRIAFHNVPYRYVITLYLVSWFVLQMVAQVLNYYMTYYLGQPKAIPLVLLSLQAASMVFLFVWSALSRLLEKRIVYILGACIWIVVQMLLSFLTPANWQLVFPLAVLGGAGVAVAYLVPWAMMPDVIEYDELETGQRREGVFYGFMVLLQKLGIAFGLFWVAQALGWAGYVAPETPGLTPLQPDSALLAIRIFMGPIPAILLLASLWTAWRYPITRAKHAEVRARLAERAAQLASNQ